jgi:hypothetical protein
MIKHRLEKISEYRSRATRYLQNFEWEIQKKDREKAGEALWGIVSCLFNAIYLLETGKPCSEHAKLRIFAGEFLVSNFGEGDGERFYDIYRKVEKFHANFYHAFLDEDEFEKDASEILRLLGILDNKLQNMLNEIAI